MLPSPPLDDAGGDVRNAYVKFYNEQLEELKTMFQQQADQELFETVKAFHTCKEEVGQSISSYVLKMKGYLDQLERLIYPIPPVFWVNLILNSLTKDYDAFVMNYNMHSMGKTIP
ncbi:hypothetical protein CTI12_AA335790 [Artemisia annua]|uniref:Zinc finger, CCHC-type n=1 Tax=Artemisia annua TaxID=35608 RepID=A0A2U1MW87_ARTAN|nr:hypothetical protein CTI12_AA335790 [Artemisia annua]